MIIDAHAHAAGAYSTAESIQATAKKYGIDKILLCTSPKNNLDLREPPQLPGFNSPNSIYLLNRMLRLAYRYFLHDHGDGNHHVLELSHQVPQVVIPFLWVNPLDAQHLNDLERNVQSYPVHGIKLHQAWNPFAIDSHEFDQLAQVAKTHHLPIFIHLYSTNEAHKLLQFASNLPEVNFIIAHLLGVDVFQAHRPILANVYFDTSGSERIRGQDILKAIRTFGSEHVIFGSDTPYAKIEDQISKIDHLGLSDAVKEHIFLTNIQNLMSLDD